MFLLYWILNNGYFAYAVSDECQEEWNYIFESQTNYTIPRVYNNMYQYSGLTLNNFGKYNLCNDIPIARYVLFEVSSKPSVFKTICGPIVCSKEDYQDLGVQLFGPAAYQVIFPHKYQIDNYSTLSTSAISIIAISLFLLFICLLATLLSSLLKENQNKNSIKYLLAFDIYRNAKFLFSARENKIKNFDVLDGIRALSTISIVMGHVVEQYEILGPLSNFAEVLDFNKNRLFSILYGGLFAVCTFFWLSGFLFAYFYMITIQSSSVTSMKVVLTYLYRVLRILPAYAFLLIAGMSLTPYLGSGPNWYEIKERINEDCFDYWYTNLLFLNNVLPNGTGNNCMEQSWFLAADMQLFVVVPLVLIMYEKLSYYIVWVIILILQVGGLVEVAITVIKYNLKVVIFSSDNNTGETDRPYKIFFHFKPFTWIAPYFIGVVCALIMISIRNKELGKKYDRYMASLVQIYENRISRYFFIILGSALMIAIILLQQDQFRYPGPERDYNYWGDEANYVFLILHRLFYSLGFSLFIMPLLLGHFPILSSFFKLKIWSVISKLSFLIYLIHVNLVLVSYYSLKSSVYLDYYTSLRDSFAYFFLSALISIPVWLVIEMPVANCIRIMFSKGDSNKEKEEDNDKPSKMKLLGDN